MGELGFNTGNSTIKSQKLSIFISKLYLTMSAKYLIIQLKHMRSGGGDDLSVAHYYIFC